MTVITNHTNITQPLVALGQKMAASPAGSKLAAMNDLRIYAGSHAVQYAGILRAEGASAAVEQFKADLTLDGYGSIMDTVADNLSGVMFIILLVALIPTITYLVISGLNVTLPATWDGGLTPESLWISVSTILGVVVTIGLISLIFKVFATLRNKGQGRQ